MQVSFQKMHESAIVPSRHFSAGGFDVCTPDDAHLAPWIVTKIPLGFATEFPDGMRAVLHDRSSMAALGLHVVGGLIDSDFRGQWILLLLNSSPNSITLSAGAKVAQVKFEIVPCTTWKVVDELHESNRGTGAFGSSGAS